MRQFPKYVQLGLIGLPVLILAATFYAGRQWERQEGETKISQFRDDTSKAWANTFEYARKAGDATRKLEQLEAVNHQMDLTKEATREQIADLIRRHALERLQMQQDQIALTNRLAESDND